MTASRAGELIAAATEEVSSSSLCASPVVSVSLFTHNQAAYVGEAVDSALGQRTGFPIELVIADDGSTDGTTELVLDYQRRHPDRVRVLLARENLGRHTGTGRLNFVRALNACRGRYVALLDGDDLWIDSAKLQRQVDLLEQAAGCAGSFHQTAMTGFDSEKVASTLPEHDLDTLGVADVVSPIQCFHTSSFVARAAALPRTFPDWFYNVCAADLPLFALTARQGPLRRVAGCMSRWRRHAGGITARPEYRGVQIHLARIEMWQAVKAELDEAGRAAADRTSAWHRAWIIEYVDGLRRENETLRRSPAGLLYTLVAKTMRRARAVSGRRR